MLMPTRTSIARQYGSPCFGIVQHVTTMAIGPGVGAILQQESADFSVRGSHEPRLIAQELDAALAVLSVEDADGFAFSLDNLEGFERILSGRVTAHARLALHPDLSDALRIFDIFACRGILTYERQLIV